MQKTKIDLILKNAREIITCELDQRGQMGRIFNAAVFISGGLITAVGDFDEIASEIDIAAAEIVDCAGKILAPGFVDCHTHVVFGGSRVKEYALKLTHTPEEVRQQITPTGIVASMQMTRAASEAELVTSASERLARMLAHGTTTVESKSGYGLATSHELKMLRVNQQLQADAHLPEIISTFLGAHAFPGDVEPQAYVDEIITEMIPAVAADGLAEFCDVYIDEGYFNLAQTRRILLAARAVGLKLKIHADQYSALGGAELAAELGAVSVDHLNYTDAATMRKLAEAGVVGVLMPLIDFAVKHPGLLMRAPCSTRA